MGGILLGSSNSINIGNATINIRSFWTWLIVAIGIVSARITYNIIYNIFLSPIKNHPGPFLNSISRWPVGYHFLVGRYNHYIRDLHDKYGPVVRIEPDTLDINSAECVHDLLSPKMMREGALRENGKMETAKRTDLGIISTDGPLHRRLHKALAAPFSNRGAMEQEKVVKDYTARFIDKLRTLAAAGEPLDMTTFFSLCTFDIMGKLTFGESFHYIRNETVSHMSETQRDMMIGWFTILGANKINTIFGKLVALYCFGGKLGKQVTKDAKMIAERTDRRIERLQDPENQEKIGYGDILGLPYKAYMNGEISMAEIQSNMSFHMIAGTETSAFALTSCLHYLLLAPEKLQRLRSELQEAISSAEDITNETTQSLPYLNACLDEALRLQSPDVFGVWRLAPPEGATVGGDWFPAKTRFALNLFALQTSSSNFALPNEFHPERFLRPPPAEFAKDKLDAHQPFLSGPRSCIGQPLAWVEMRLILSNILLAFDFTLPDDSEGYPDVRTHWHSKKAWNVWERCANWVKLNPREV